MEEPDSLYTCLLLEGKQQGQDGAAIPQRVIAPREYNDLNLHHGGSKGSDLLLNPVGNTWEQGGPTAQHHIGT